MTYIFGDSFAVNSDGWVGMLGRDVRIFSQNGVGEYKIYKQVIENLKFDQAIICHTSPWRVHTRMHPVHKNNLINTIREKIIKGTPTICLSAGTNIISPTIETTNDMPIIEITNLNSLNIIPFQMNLHYHNQDIF